MQLQVIHLTHMVDGEFVIGIILVDTVAERDWICVLGVFDLPLNDELFTFAFGWDEISDEKMLIVDIFDEGVRSG